MMRVEVAGCGSETCAGAVRAPDAVLTVLTVRAVSLLFGDRKDIKGAVIFFLKTKVSVKFNQVKDFVAALKNLLAAQGQELRSEGPSLSRTAWPFPLTVYLCVLWFLPGSGRLFCSCGNSLKPRLKLGLPTQAPSVWSFSDSTTSRNPDCKPCEDWLRAGLGCLLSTNTQRNETLVLLSVEWGLLLTHLCVHWRCSPLGFQHYGRGLQSDSTHLDWVPGSLQKFRRSMVWQKFSGWKPALAFIVDQGPCSDSFLQKTLFFANSLKKFFLN